MLLEQLSASLKEAMVAKDEFKVSLLRMIMAAVHNKEIEKGKDKGLTEDDVMDVLKKELKKRKESADAYASANRPELAQKETKEAEFISGLLPAQMAESEIEAIVLEVLKDFENPSQKDFGIIMKKAMEKIAGRADGSSVSAVIKKHLS
jgi:hypothetical protein